MKRWASAAALLAATVWVSASGDAWAGEVIFKNGDRLTGEVTTLVDGRLKIKSKVAGEVTVDLKDVASFTTDEPIKVKLKDGTVIEERLTATTQPGMVAVAPAGPTEKPDDGPGTGDAPTTKFAEAAQISLDRFSTINEQKPKLWSGNVKAGALLTRGNSDTDAFNLSADASRRTKQDRLTLQGQYLYGREHSDGDDNVTTDNWTLQGKYDYFISKKLYEYNVIKAERDNIADLEIRLQPGIGLGYQWIEGPKENFRQEIGIGYTYEKYRGESEDEYLNARYAHSYDHQFRDNVKFIHNFEILPSFEDISVYTLTADAGLRFKLTDKFFTDIKIEWKRNSDPGPDTKEDDFRYILGLGWEF